MRDLFCWFLLMMFYVPLLAQEDQRVSPDYTTRELPAELRIEAVASSGSATIVAWGANRSYGSDSAIGNLQMQRMIDSVLLGSPLQLHSDEARPSGFCSVVPFPGKFLILWNDRRTGNPGVYMRWVDTAGSFLAEEELFSSPGARISDGFKVFRMPDATLILWQELIEGKWELKLRRLTADGAFIEAERSLGAADGDELWAPGGHNDLILLRRTGIVRSLRSDGTFDPRPIPATRFDGPILIDADSTATLLRDSTLEIYRTIFDTIPIGTLEIPSPRVESFGVLSRDTGGNYRIHYGARYTEWWGGSLKVHRIIVSPDGLVGRSELIDSMPHTSYDYTRTTSLPDLPSRTARCDGGTSILFTTRLITHGHYGVVERDWTVASAYRIGPDGEYAREPLPLVSTPLCFDGEWTQPVIVRTRFTDTSMVRVEGKGAVGLFHSPIVSRPYIDCQSRPNLVLHDGRIRTSWITSAFDGTASHPYPAEMVAAEWEPTTGRPAFDLSHLYPTADYDNGTTSARYRSTYWRLPGATIVTDEFEREIPDQHGVTHTTGANIFMMVDGWKKIEEVPEQTNSSMAWIPYPTDPNSRGVAGLSWRNSPYLLRDREGNRAYSLPRPTTQADVIVPIDSARHLVIKDSTAYVDSLGTKTRSFVLPSLGNFSSHYQRLLGPRFLRLTRISSRWQLDIYPVLGAAGYSPMNSPIYSRALVPSTTARTPVILQNPADSSIMILWGSDHGVRLSWLDQYLRLAVSDSLVSATDDSVANPVGLFRNDTLFVAWEDFRNMGSDIYGTARRMQRMTSSPPRAPIDTTIVPGSTTITPFRTSAAITAITPNPADRTATFFVELASPGNAVAEILDMTGQTLVRNEKFFDMESGRWDIDIADLTNGMYVLSVRAGGSVDMKKLVVVRE